VLPTDAPRPWRRRTAAGVAALLGTVAIFQVVVVLGAPVGRFTQRGRQVGVLGPAGRVLGAVSAVLLMLTAVAIIGRVGAGPVARWRARRLVVACRGHHRIVTLAANLASKSIDERVTFVPATALTLLLTVVSAHTRWFPARTGKSRMTS
jgi:hypothetical protein